MGDGWTADPLRSPLRFVYTAADAVRTREWLLEDGLAMAAVSRTLPGPGRATRSVEGVVQRILSGGSRAFVRLADGGLVTISAELLLPGVPLDWYLEEGAPVRGQLDAPGVPLRLGLRPATDRDLLVRFGPGAVTLALVRSVGRQEATLLLHFAVAVPVRRADVTSNPRDLVDHLLGEGEVVSADRPRPAGPSAAAARRFGGRRGAAAGGVPDRRRSALAAGGSRPGDGPARRGGRRGERPGSGAAVGRPGDPGADRGAPPPPGPRPRAAAPPPRQPDRLATRGGISLQQALLQIESLKGEVRRLQEQQRGDAAHADSALTLELGQERAKVADLQHRLRHEQREAADLGVLPRDVGRGVTGR